MNEILDFLMSSFVYILIAAMMLVGLGLSVFNSIGLFLIWGAMLVSGIYDGFDKVPVWIIVFFLLTSVLSVFIDNLTVMYGAKKMGAGKWGIVGAVLGAIVGLIVGNIFGVLIGPFIGAALFEVIFEKKEFKPALKAGFGTFLGFITGVVIKFGLGVAMIVTWLYLWFF